MAKKPGAKALVVYGGKILLVLRDNIPTIANPNKWNTPGGGVEEGETPEEGLIRELKEEVNLIPSMIKELGTTIYSDGSIVYRFYVPVTDEEFANIRLGNEGQKLDWFTMDEILQLDQSPNSFIYFQAHEQDIKNILSGHSDFVPRHDIQELLT